MILEAANGDPLRAQEIEANITGAWWQRWSVYHEEQAEAAKAEQRKQKHRR